MSRGWPITEAPSVLGSRAIRIVRTPDVRQRRLRCDQGALARARRLALVSAGRAETRRYARDLVQDRGMRVIARFFVPTVIASLLDPGAHRLGADRRPVRIPRAVSSGVGRCGSSCSTTSPGRSTRSATSWAVAASSPATSRATSGGSPGFPSGESWHNNHHAFPHLRLPRSASARDRPGGLADPGAGANRARLEGHASGARAPAGATPPTGPRLGASLPTGTRITELTPRRHAFEAAGARALDRSGPQPAGRAEGETRRRRRRLRRACVHCAASDFAEVERGLLIDRVSRHRVPWPARSWRGARKPPGGSDTRRTGAA